MNVNGKNLASNVELNNLVETKTLFWGIFTITYCCRYDFHLNLVKKIPCYTVIVSELVSHFQSFLRTPIHNSLVLKMSLGINFEAFRNNDFIQLKKSISGFHLLQVWRLRLGSVQEGQACSIGTLLPSLLPGQLKITFHCKIAHFVLFIFQRYSIQILQTQLFWRVQFLDRKQ